MGISGVQKYIGTELVSKGYKDKNTEEEEPEDVPSSEQHYSVTTMFKYLQSRVVLSVKITRITFSVR